MSGLKLEHIACNTPEQNGHIESFYKTLKKEYIWPYDFRTYQQVEAAIRDAFIDYNRDRIHSSLGVSHVGTSFCQPCLEVQQVIIC
jgi:putative transposase